MPYYHCSPIAGLTELTPKQPAAFEKPRAVYMTTLLPMALMYGVRNFEYTYGYTRDGQIYFEEYFPDALEVLYRGRQASLYLCSPSRCSPTQIPNEAVSTEAVAVLQERVIPDVCEALLEQERLGKLVIRRYEALTEKDRDWICSTQCRIIREKALLRTPGPMADYYRTRYPKSWAEAERIHP